MTLWVEISAHSLCRIRKFSFFFARLIPLLIIAQLACRSPITSSAQQTEIWLSDDAQMMQKPLAQGERHLYQIKLTAGQYFRVLLRHPGIKLQLNLYDPEGRTLSSFQYHQSGTIPLSAIAEQSGIYRIEIVSKEITSYTGNYKIQLAENRPKHLSNEDRITADKAVAMAQSTSVEMPFVALKNSLANHQQAQTLWHKLEETKEEAFVLNSIGEIQQQFGETDTAQQSFEQALALCSDNQELKIEVQNNLFSLQRDDPTYCSQLEETSRAIGYKRGEALALDNLGEWARNSGDRQRARDYQLRSLALWREIQDRQKQANVLNNLACISVELAEPFQATDYFNQSLLLWQNIDDKTGLAATLTAMGNFQNLLGKKQEALDLYEKARQQAAISGDKARLIGISNGTGFVHESYGQYEKARTFYEQSFRVAQEIQSEKLRSGSLINIGVMHRLLGQQQKALSSFQAALTLIKKNKNGLYLPFVLLNMGIAYGEVGQKEVALANLQQAAKLSLANKDMRGAATAYNGIGEIHQKAKQLHLARQYHSQALQLDQTVHNPFGETQTRHHLARTEFALGNTMEAISEIQKAIEGIEKLRANVISPTLRISYLAAVYQSYELLIELLMRQSQKDSNRQLATDALTISERSRARSFLESIHESSQNIKQGVDPTLLEQERTLQQMRNSKADRKLQLVGKQDKEAELAVITKELEDLSSQLDDVRSKIRATSPRYAALTQPQPLKAAEIQQLLDDDTMLLEYALGDERSYVWAVTRNSIEAYPLPNRATIESLVREVYQLMTTSPQQEGETAGQWHQRVTQADQQYWPRAAQLSQMVLGPMAEKLSNKRLLIVGDGALQLLPFAALPVPQSDGESRVLHSASRGENPKLKTQNSKPLIADHEITYLPSASSLQMLRQDRAKPEPPSNWLARWSHSLRSWLGQDTPPASLYSVAVLADPVFGKEDKRMAGKEPQAVQSNQPQMRDVDLSDKNVFLPRLIATREEAEEIQKAAGANAFLLKQGFEVNRSLLESEELNRYGVVHLATHGFWDSTNPEMSGIFLSRFDRQGNSLEDGTLRLSDIYNLKLPKELVVLSACETAVGKDIRGEGLIALTRGFMYAGAARVMASLWKVEDNATAEMMKIFYQHLLRDKMSPAAALRQAQIAMWQKDPAQTPYNWAAFVLQGEYR